MAEPEIVVSGVGCITPIGLSLEDLGAALREGESGIGEIASFDPAPFPCRHGAEVLDLELSDFLESKKTYIDRTSAFVLAACAAALKEAHWVGDENVGLVLGTAWGCMDSLELFAEKVITGNPKFAPPLPFTHSYPNAPNSLASIEFKLRGFNACLTCGHTCGLAAVEWACRRIALGRDRRLLAGGSEALSRSLFESCALKGLLDEAGDPRPYDPSSGGLVLGEGAAVFALQDAEFARQWDDPELAIVAGYASARDDDPARGLERTMSKALEMAGVAPRQVDVVIGTGNGHPVSDAAELEAVRRVFGDARPALTSVKAWVGEAVGAGGPLGLAAALCSLEDQFIPAASAAEPPQVEGVRMVAGEVVEMPVRAVVVNSCDPGGAAVSLVLTAP